MEKVQACNQELRQAYSDYIDGLITEIEYFKRIALIAVRYNSK